MKLITEEISQVKFITEGKGKTKRLCIEGVFLQGGIKNRNGRMYPVDILENEVNRYNKTCLLYTSPSPRDRTRSRMPSSA